MSAVTRFSIPVLAAALLAGTGCYHYVEYDLDRATTPTTARAGGEEPVRWLAVVVDGERLPSGPRRAASEATIAGGSARAEQLGRTRVTRMDRTQVELDDTVLDAAGVRGRTRDDARAMVSVPMAEIQLLEVREMDKGGTFLLAGGVAAAGVAAILLSGGDDGPGDGGGGYTPPE